MHLVHLISPALDYVIKGAVGGPLPIVASDTEWRAWEHVKRAIFIYSSEPCRQLHSQFRRTGGSRQSYNMINMQKRMHAGEKIAKAQLPHDDMHDFVEGGRDTELLEENFDSWTTKNNSLHFPILALHIDAAYEHAADITSFMGLPSSAAFNFPLFKARTTMSPDEAKDVALCKKSGIYTSLEAKIEATDRFKIVW